MIAPLIDANRIGKTEDQTEGLHVMGQAAPYLLTPSLLDNDQELAHFFFLHYS